MHEKENKSHHDKTHDKDKSHHEKEKNHHEKEKVNIEKRNHDDKDKLFSNAFSSTMAIMNLKR